MPINKNALAEREAAAREAIKHAFGTEEDEHGATLFVAHHLEEIESDYWQAHLGTSQPAEEQVLAILELKTVSNADSLDFTLPEEVTDYVICVGFDEAGKIASISMES